jgi:hypothetical protein
MTAWLKENLIPEHEAEFRRAEHQCFDSNNNQYADVDMSKYFKRGYKSMIEDEVPRSVRHWGGSMGLRGPPKAPWYLYQVSSQALMIAKAMFLLIKTYRPLETMLPRSDSRTRSMRNTAQTARQFWYVNFFAY